MLPTANEVVGYGETVGLATPTRRRCWRGAKQGLQAESPSGAGVSIAVYAAPVRYLRIARFLSWEKVQGGGFGSQAAELFTRDATAVRVVREGGWLSGVGRVGVK